MSSTLTVKELRNLLLALPGDLPVRVLDRTDWDWLPVRQILLCRTPGWVLLCGREEAPGDCDLELWPAGGEERTDEARPRPRAHVRRS